MIRSIGSDFDLMSSLCLENVGLETLERLVKIYGLDFRLFDYDIQPLLNLIEAKKQNNTTLSHTEVDEFNKTTTLPQSIEEQ